MKNNLFSKLRVLIGIVLVSLGLIFGGVTLDRYYGLKFLDKLLPSKITDKNTSAITDRRILNEESTVIDIVDKVGPSVVTVSISKTQAIQPFDIWDPFGFFGQQQPSTQQEKIEQDIGTGFVIRQDGLIVTNKHVVSDREAKYRVITNDNKEYQVERIDRDPSNDVSFIRIDAKGLKPVILGDSQNLKVGQFVVAIGTALGEFRNTVTTGVISGLGRGITAGSPLEGYVERLDNVIQTDAAINPGNSGGPLLNSLGQVIGINVAVAANGENIGFAIPISVVKESLDNFNKTGKFSRPYLGVRYRMISQATALMNDVPQGALVIEVVENSPASQVGVKVGDIITKLDDQAIKESDGGLAKIISSKKSGQEVKLTIWRDGEEKEINLKLEEFES